MTTATVISRNGRHPSAAKASRTNRANEMSEHTEPVTTTTATEAIAATGRKPRYRLSFRCQVQVGGVALVSPYSPR